MHRTSFHSRPGNFSPSAIHHTHKFTPPPWYKGGGGWMERLPGFFDVLLYFETILPSVENL